MPTVWINARETLACLTGERLLIKPLTDASDLAAERSIPLIDVDCVVAIAGVQLTTPLIHKLMARSIPLFLLNSIGQVRGQFLPPQRASARLRCTQYLHALGTQSTTTTTTNTECPPPTAEQTAAALIRAKLYNQRRVLQRLRLNRPDSPADKFSEKRIGRAIQHLAHAQAPKLDVLLGIEGSHTADFLVQWSRYLPPEFPLERRSRRPPHNPVNACLSFIATLLYHEMLAACFAAGLDPAIGSLHALQEGRWSLPLDLIEPFRPILTEPITLDLISRSILNQADFEPMNDGIYLNHTGRRKVILHYEKRLERYFHSEHIGQRTSLRIQLRKAALNYRAHLLEHRPLNPFQMN